MAVVLVDRLTYGSCSKYHNAGTVIDAFLLSPSSSGVVREGHNRRYFESGCNRKQKTSDGVQESGVR